MKNKASILLAGLVIASSASFASNIVTRTSEEAAPLERCVEWKTVCYQKTFCIQRSALRGEGCYRCIKPSQFGFHVYPRQIDRNTCSDSTADYLRTMGYRCYHAYDTSPCLQTRERQYCDQQCVQFEH